LTEEIGPHLESLFTVIGSLFVSGSAGAGGMATQIGGLIDQITDLHIRDTINELIARSSLIAERIESGKLAVVGANYKLTLGEIQEIVAFGKIK
jgi:carbonic anhydrase